MSPEEKVIRTLNEAYIQAFLASDAGWYERYLDDDFSFIDRHGAVVNKSSLLQITEAGTDVEDYQLDEVTVRVYGDAAIVRALGIFKRADGTTGKTRYTDIYVRKGSEWRVIAAQVTPVASSLATV
jgi:ketosteroid isomerase-like protein